MKRCLRKSAAQLNATAAVPDTFVVIPAAGTFPSAGSGPVVTVAFTPAAATNFTTSPLWGPTAYGVLVMKQIIGHPPVLLALGVIFLAYAAAFFNRSDNRAEQAAPIARSVAAHWANHRPTAR